MPLHHSENEPRHIEPRRYHRIQSRTLGHVQIAGQQSMLAAVVVDWSAAGAQIKLQSEIKLPSIFNFYRTGFSGDPIGIMCQLKWQIGKSVGVVFIPQAGNARA